MRLVFVDTPAAGAGARSTSRLCANDARGSRTAASSRGTHSTLWANTAQRRAVEQRRQRVPVARQVARQQFDARRAAAGVHRVDAAPVVPGAAVGQVVAVDDRDHDIVQPQPLDRVGQPLGLVRVRRRRRLQRLDRAEPATARAALRRRP